MNYSNMLKLLYAFFELRNKIKMINKCWRYVVIFLVDCLGFLYFIPIWNFAGGTLRCLADGKPVGTLFIMVFIVSAIFAITAFFLSRHFRETKIRKRFFTTVNIICGITMLIFVVLTALLIMTELNIPWFPAQK